MKGYFKCRNCRHLLDLQSDAVCTNHKIILADLELDLSNTDHPQFTVDDDNKVTCEDNHYFLIDSKLNDLNWIVDQLDRQEWKKGTFKIRIDLLI